MNREDDSFDVTTWEAPEVGETGTYPQLAGEEQAPKPIRDELGRIVPGSPSLNPHGRPPRATENRFHRMLSEIFTEETILKMQQSLQQRVERGDVRVIRELLPYLVPKLAAGSLDLSGEDGVITLRLVPDDKR
jgi:hypothetical protein